MTEAGAGPVPGPDGLARCPWALGVADYLTYHDEDL
jgi:DNA-3-methyladenine glycosylase I